VVDGRERNPLRLGRQVVTENLPEEGMHDRVKPLSKQFRNTARVLIYGNGGQLARAAMQRIECMIR